MTGKASGRHEKKLFLIRKKTGVGKFSVEESKKTDFFCLPLLTVVNLQAAYYTPVMRVKDRTDMCIISVQKDTNKYLRYFLFSNSVSRSSTSLRVNTSLLPSSSSPPRSLSNFFCTCLTNIYLCIVQSKTQVESKTGTYF